MNKISQNTNTTIPILGFNITTLKVNEVVDIALGSLNCTVVNTLNPHSYAMQKSDSTFEDALRFSDFLIPDGSGIVLAAKILEKVYIKKIAGFDLFQETMINLNQRKGNALFIGSTEKTLDLLCKRAQTDFLNVKVTCHSPPFKPEFNQQDIARFIDIINQVKPDVVFVGLTAPKQEKLIQILQPQSCARMMCGIGAVFDFYAGTVKRPNQIWLKLHLEWLIRLIGEPKRLWRRNFISLPIFLFDIVKSKLRLK